MLESAIGGAQMFTHGFFVDHNTRSFQHMFLSSCAFLQLEQLESLWSNSNCQLMASSQTAK